MREIIARALGTVLVVTLVVTGCGSKSARNSGATEPVESTESTALSAAAKEQATALKGEAEGPFAKTGFVTVLEEDRLWVFREDSGELEAFESSGELAKHTTQIGVGPAGLTMKAPDRETILEYLAAKPGFTTTVDEGRVWVFRNGSEELDEVLSGGELAKHVTRVSAGPLDVTLEAPDKETLDEYLAWKEGFVTHVVDGRLWVFHEGSTELKDFESVGPLAEHVTRVGAGPGGMTLKGPDRETIIDYVTVMAGFETFVNADGRLWVFRADSRALDEFYKLGKPEKHITRVGAGPLGLTIKAPDAETADAYLRTYTLWY
jgi:hypothetical protein